MFALAGYFLAHGGQLGLARRCASGFTMAQQVNLYLPILRKQQTPFTGLALLQAWLILMVLGGALGAAWVWSLKQASASLNATLLAQGTELDGLRAALANNQAGAAPAQSTTELTLTARKSELAKREAVLTALQQGYFEPGFGHSARLQLVARTIAPQAWVTQITADDQALEVAGFTLEPAVLTGWVNRLSASPLLQGQVLSTVKVDRINIDSALPEPVATGAVAASALAQKPASWSFAILSKLATSAAAPKSKP